MTTTEALTKVLNTLRNARNKADDKFALYDAVEKEIEHLLKEAYTKENKEISIKQKKHLQKVHRARKNATEEKIDNLTGGLCAEEYKKEDGTWNIYKIAKDSKTARQTVRKYIAKYL